MSFNFGSLFAALSAFFHTAQSAPAVVAQSADELVGAAAPVIDSLAGEGTAAKITHEIDATKRVAVDFLTPHLQQAEMAETVLQGVTTILTTGAAKAAAVAAPAPAPAAESAPAPAAG